MATPASIGRHAVTGLLGEGGMGVVYVTDGFFCVPALARDPWLDSLRGTI